MNTPSNLSDSWRQLSEARRAIERIAPQGELEARLRNSMLDAAGMIAAAHASVELLESFVTRTWRHIDVLQRTFRRVRETTEGEIRDAPSCSAAAEPANRDGGG